MASIIDCFNNLNATSSSRVHLNWQHVDKIGQKGSTKVQCIIGNLIQPEPLSLLQNFQKGAGKEEGEFFSGGEVKFLHKK